MSQSLERALLLLEELAAGPQRLGPLAERLDAHKSTVLRTLQTLERYGYVCRKGEVPEFALDLRLVELASAVLENLDVRTVAREHLERLGEETNETVHLAVRDGSMVVYVDKVESTHPVRMYSRVGARGPAHCTGVGKVLLAFTPVEEWPEMELHRFTDRTIGTREELVDAAEGIRRRGWGWDEQEHEETIRCIAAPVFGQDGRVIAAVSISVPTSRLSTTKLRSHVPLLMDATRQISAGLGGGPPRRHETSTRRDSHRW